MFGRSFRELLDKSRQASDARDRGGAVDYALAAVEKEPNNPEGYLVLANAYSYASGDLSLDEAEKHECCRMGLRAYDIVLEHLDSGAPPEFAARIWTQKAMLFRRLGDQVGDRQCGAEADRLVPGHTAAQQEHNVQKLRSAMERVSRRSQD